MKPYLLYRDQDFSPRWGMIRISPSPHWWRDRDADKQWEVLPPPFQRVTQDLELDILINAMAAGDRFLFEVVKNVLLISVADTGTIQYRQDVLRDCLKNPETMRRMYLLSAETIDRHKKAVSWYSNQSADSIMRTSIQALELFLASLADLRKLAYEQGAKFESEGFRKFFAMVEHELPDEYFASIRDILDELKFPYGQLISAEIGQGNKGTSYALRRYRGIRKKGFIDRIFSKEQPCHYSFTIHERDQSGFRALGELRGRSMNTIANTLAQSSDHILNFFIAMKTELAFYLGCVQLHEQLARIGEPVCFPVANDPGRRTLAFEGLYDVCLALKTGGGVIGNDADAKGKDLVIITGANRGGKSTFLRSLGLAQLMMQSGSFVPARSFRADVCNGIFTHFKREEDRTMKSGKLDEELNRMSELAHHLTPDSMVLFNESFAATNEREGSEISWQIVRALQERRIKVIFVTHLYEFSRRLYETNPEKVLFMRAERKPNGERTFRIVEGEPLQTSYGRDLYTRIFFGSPSEDTPGDSPDT